MILFAAIIKHDQPNDLPILVEAVFMLALLICFLRVANYVAGQIETRRLINNENTPLDFRVSGIYGWLFVVGVLAMIFIEPIFYIILVFVGIATLLVENRRTAEEQFGLGRLPALKVLRWSLLVCGAVIFIETPLSQLWLRVMDVIHLPHPEQQPVETFRECNNPLDILGFMIQAVILLPMIEELFFRGFLLTFLKKYTTTWLALVLSAGVFAFAHVNLGAVLPLWVLGVVLGVAYQHTGSLLLPIGVHAFWNLFTALSLLYDKGSA